MDVFSTFVSSLVVVDSSAFCPPRFPHLLLFLASSEPLIPGALFYAALHNISQNWPWLKTSDRSCIRRTTDNRASVSAQTLISEGTTAELSGEIFFRMVSKTNNRRISSSTHLLLPCGCNFVVDLGNDMGMNRGKNVLRWRSGKSGMRIEIISKVILNFPYEIRKKKRKRIN